MNPRIVFALAALACLLPAKAVLANSRQSAGGWGQQCWTNITCSSGGKLSCNFTANDNATRSECISNTGNNAWIRCALYDSFGNQTNFYSDQCP